MTTGTPVKPQPDGADPSMEEILASIRRILNEDEGDPAPSTDAALPSAAAPPAAAAQAPAPAPAAPDDVLVLDESMMVSVASAEPPAAPRAEAPQQDALPPIVAARPSEPATPPVPKQEAPTPDTPPAAPEARPAVDRPASELVAPETAAAAATSLGSLVRTLSSGRQTPVYSGGPTLEDMVRAELRTMLKAWLDAQLPSLLDQIVRAEMRPVLKAWLDLNLPPMVEALVRAEIEKVVGQAAP